MSSSIDPANTQPSGETGRGLWGNIFLVLFAVSAGFAILVMVAMNLPSGVPDMEIVATMTDLREFDVNLQRFQTMAGRLPSESEALLLLAKKGRGDSREPFMKTDALVDRWGHPYQYRNPGKRHPEGVDVYSMGPDGQDGTEDDIYAPE